jgi:hypothetical protein
MPDFYNPAVLKRNHGQKVHPREAAMRRLARLSFEDRNNQHCILMKAKDLPRSTSFPTSRVVSTCVLASVLMLSVGTHSAAGALCRADFVDADVNSWTVAYRVVSDGPVVYCSVTPTDHLVAGMVVDNLFAPGTIRQALRVELFEASAIVTGANWLLVYKKALYVDQDNAEHPEVVGLTTLSPTGPDDDVPEAELQHIIKPGKVVIIGTCKLPLSIVVRKTEFAAP